MVEPSLECVRAVVVLDNDGKRIVSKYYVDSLPTLKEQHKFEETLFSKTRRANDEVIMHEGFIAVYKSNVDLYFYVLGAPTENELLLLAVLNALYDSVNSILRRNVEKRVLLEHLDALYLVLDELVDGGIIVETDPAVVCHRVSLRLDESSFSEQSVKQVLQSAKENLKWSLLK